MKICKRCGQSKSPDQYGPLKAAADGLQYWCRQCRAEYEQEKRECRGIVPKPKPAMPDSEHKECLRCHQIHHINAFARNKRGRLGRAAYCIPCQKEYQKEIRTRPGQSAKVRAATQRYRDKNREHWRGLHRINQFNRKSTVKARSDGTVTAEFMRELYATERCCWCNKPTPEDQRTAEHVVPLCNGGVHGVSNLKMACLKCNSSKVNLQQSTNVNPSSNHSGLDQS